MVCNGIIIFVYLSALLSPLKASEPREPINLGTTPSFDPFNSYVTELNMTPTPELLNAQYSRKEILVQHLASE